jgi:nicotinamidase-related amidase
VSCDQVLKNDGFSGVLPGATGIVMLQHLTQGSAPMPLDLTHAVLLPIDMQQGFNDPSWPQRWNTKCNENGIALLEGWRKSLRPIIHVRHDSVDVGSSLNPQHIGNRMIAGFEAKGLEPTVSKSVNSAFIATDLDLRLRRMNARCVVAFGYSTDMCVSTTIRTGANMGWRMILVTDACDCFDMKGSNGDIIPAKTVHDVHVATLGFEFCTVVTTRQLLNQL